MPIILHSSTERPARADLDPPLTANCEELQPRLAEIDYPSIDIPIWIADFWSHAAKYLPPDGRTWIVRDEAGRAVGWGTLRRVRHDAGEMKRLFVLPDARGRSVARRLVQARIDDARASGELDGIASGGGYS